MVDADQVRAKLEAGRRAVSGRLRNLADSLDALPLDDAGEALVWIQDGLDQLEHEAARILSALGHR